MSHQLPNSKYDILSMEINGTPYYVASKEGVPYLYDVDTREEVGYWSSKKGQYIMFSLYNKLMKKKYENLSDSSEYTDDLETMQPKSDSDSGLGSPGSREEIEYSGSESESQKEKEESEPGSQEDIQIKKNHLKKMFMFTFIMFFVYLTLQKKFQSIYFDFIFLICINLLNMFKVFEVLNDER